MVAEEEISAANVFLAPVLDKRSKSKASKLSLIDRLSSYPAREGESLRKAVIQKALHLLLAIHHALTEKNSLDAVREVLYNSGNRRVIDALFDLLSLEGIYPNLCLGVGMPIDRRVSALQGGFDTKPIVSTEHTASGQDFMLLGEIVEQLAEIARGTGGGLEKALQDRILVDILAAVFQLAYHPLYSDIRYKVLLKQLLDCTPLSVLFPTLTSLLYPVTPSWLQPHLSTARASLPLQADGVRQTIIFIAKSMPQATVQTSANVPPTGPSLALEVLNQASRLICSVPSTVSVEAYFNNIALQLLALLDGDDVDMRCAASFIIGFGILGRRNTGAPGTVGWKLLVEPLIAILSPHERLKGPAHAVLDSPDLKILQPKSCVTTADFQLGLSRLSALILIHPNPSLTKRLLTPLLLPIWGMICHAKEERVVQPWVEQCFNLISTYLKISAGTTGFIRLVDNILWDGGHDWEYILDVEGYLSIQRRHDGSSQPVNADIVVSKIDLRLETYKELLDCGAVDDAEIGEIFLHITEHWLGKRAPNTQSLNPIMEADATEDPITSLIYAKAAQGMLWKYRAVVTKHPIKLLHMVKQLLERFTTIMSQDDGEQQQVKASKLSISDLDSIVRHPSQDGIATSNNIKEDDSDIISGCLSILSIVLSPTDSSVSIEISNLLDSLQPILFTIGLPRSSLPDSIRLTARNISALITIHISRDMTSQIPASPTFNRYAEDRKKHSLALTHVNDSLPPVRAQGLSVLIQLIETSSPILDIPSTCILLISMLQDEEEYIYLSAIKGLGLLSSRHSRVVVKMLVEQYVDPEDEMGLDQRLKIGEALLKTVEGLGTALRDDMTIVVAEGVIAVAGRRGKRSKSLRQKQESVAKDLATRKEAEDAWGGEVPQFDDEENEDPVNERVAKVLETWEGKEGEEDIRIRTSALSILGVAIESNIAGMGSSIASTAIDLAISILKVEIVPEKAILRRAATLIIMSLVRALDQAREEGRQLRFGLAGESLEEVLKVLKYIEATDSDDVVRGHVMEVIDGLAVWRSKSLIDMTRGDMQLPHLGVNGRLAGLSVNPETRNLSQLRIEELE